MILEYTKTTTVDAVNGCKHEVDGVVQDEDIMKTLYVPTNFVGETKNYYLRKNHSSWDMKHRLFETQIHKEWLIELGYETSNYSVNSETKEVVFTAPVHLESNNEVESETI